MIPTIYVQVLTNLFYSDIMKINYEINISKAVLYKITTYK